MKGICVREGGVGQCVSLLLDWLEEDFLRAEALVPSHVIFVLCFMASLSSPLLITVEVHASTPTYARSPVRPMQF